MHWFSLDRNNPVNQNKTYYDVTHDTEYVLSDVDNVVDRGSCIVDLSDSESSDGFVEFNEIDDSLVMIEQQRPTNF